MRKSESQPDALTEGTPAKAELPKVLVVDDDPFMLKLIGLQLRRFATVSVQHNPVTALTELEDDLPDVVILDVIMPQMNGVELAQAIRDRHADTGLICITACLEEDVVVDALRAGIDDFLRKPFEPSEIVRVVRRVFETAKRRRDAARARQLEAVLATVVSVSHEVLNPMTGLLGELDLLIETEDLEEETADALCRARNAGHRIVQFVHRLQRIADVRFTTYLGDERMLDLESRDE